jgi:hypothetical protein
MFLVRFSSIQEVGGIMKSGSVFGSVQSLTGTPDQFQIKSRNPQMKLNPNPSEWGEELILG